MGTSRGKKNRTPHSQFWKELTHVWHDNVGRETKWQASNHLASFLIACSKPFFPGEATDPAISAFIERNVTSSK
jgi:hypothetical protein